MSGSQNNDTPPRSVYQYELEILLTCCLVPAYARLENGRLNDSGRKLVEAVGRLLCGDLSEQPRKQRLHTIQRLCRTSNIGKALNRVTSALSVAQQQHHHAGTHHLMFMYPMDWCVLCTGASMNSHAQGADGHDGQQHMPVGKLETSGQRHIVVDVVTSAGLKKGLVVSGHACMQA